MSRKTMRAGWFSSASTTRSSPRRTSATRWICADNHDEIREVAKEELDFEHRDGTWTLVGERGVDVQDLTRIPVE